MSLSVVILAAGKGSRMNSNKPKVLQTLAGKPLIEHVVSAVENLGADNIIVVTGHMKEKVEQSLADRNITFVYQEDQLGNRSCCTADLTIFERSENFSFIRRCSAYITRGTKKFRKYNT